MELEKLNPPVKGVVSVPVQDLETTSLEELQKDALDDDQLQKKNPLKKSGILFPVESIPPWYIVVLYAFQQVFNVIDGPVTASFVIHSLVCGGNDTVFLAELIGTSIFMNGLCTFLQCTFGLRLPIIQGSTFIYVSIIASFMLTPQWRCPETNHPNENNGSSSSADDISWNSSLLNASESVFPETPWKPRMREISGGLIIAAMMQVLLGCTGMVGILMRFIGPLTIAPAVSLLTLSMQRVIGNFCSQHWGVSLSTTAVFLLVSLLLRNVLVPLPAFNKTKGIYFVRYPMFRLFPSLFACAFGWILCLILTAAGQLPDQPGALGYRARTDIRTDNIVNNKWFFLPYPGMWGFPTFTASVLLGMFAVTICVIVESIGDYYATARACGVPPPPTHAVNRGIAMEGFGSVICGLLGTAHATTSYSQMTGFIPLTGMASRITSQLAGVVLMATGVFGKFGAALSMIPDPVLGGQMLVAMGLVLAVGLSNIQFVDISTGRNMTILGTSILLGLVLPDWINRNSELINTGNSQADQMLTILLGTPMFVGGFVGCLLDNTMPGSLEERGMTKFRQIVEDVTPNDSEEDDEKSNSYRVYDLPCMERCSFHKHSFFTYLPFLPCYKNRSLGIGRRCSCCKKK